MVIIPQTPTSASRFAEAVEGYRCRAKLCSA